MGTSWDAEELGQRRPVAVIVRLLLDGRGTLYYGEIVDTAGAVQRRFAAWEELVPALRGWLEGAAE